MQDINMEHLHQKIGVYGRQNIFTTWCTVRIGWRV